MLLLGYNPFLFGIRTGYGGERRKPAVNASKRSRGFTMNPATPSECLLAPRWKFLPRLGGNEKPSGNDFSTSRTRGGKCTPRMHYAFRASWTYSRCSLYFALQFTSTRAALSWFLRNFIWRAVLFLLASFRKPDLKLCRVESRGINLRGGTIEKFIGFHDRFFKCHAGCYRI